MLNARRVRRQIGRSPNLKPRGTKERLLYLAWLAVILVWVGQPVVMHLRPNSPLLHPLVALNGPAALAVGLAGILAAQAGTFWCYRAMGRWWRIGVRKAEQPELVQSGPYRRVRHPIYSFQMLLLASVVVLLPTGLSLAMLAVHVITCWIKASDEEAYFLSMCPGPYGDYRRRTSRFSPRVFGVRPGGS